VSAVSLIDSTDDVFAEFCGAQVELVARALGRGARCMLYLRASGVDGENLQLTEVASYPPSPRWGDDETRADAMHSFEMTSRGTSSETPADAFGVAASSFADSLGGEQLRQGSGSSRDAEGEGNTSITLRGGGSADDGDGFQTMTAAEALLVKQRVFALPSTNALVVPLSRDDVLLGLLVGEMPDGGGWKGNSARTRKERERRRDAEDEIPEVEVLPSGSSLDEERSREAQDTAEKFGDRRKAALAAAARSIVAAWTMHRRADHAAAAALRSDERVDTFTTAARGPLTVLRTLGGMLSTHLKPETPSKDMAEAIVAQSDVLAALSTELESALYPMRAAEDLTRGDFGNRSKRSSASFAGARGGGDGKRALPAPPGTHKSARKSTTATSEALASGVSPRCDVTPLVAGLLASAEVMAKQRNVTMTVSFPDDDLGSTAARGVRASVRADPRDVRETLALVIDAALVAAPRNGKVDVAVRANGGRKGGVVVAVGVSSGNQTEKEEEEEEEVFSSFAALPVDGVSASASNARSDGYFLGAGSGTSEAATKIATKIKMKTTKTAASVPLTIQETQNLQIARSLVEGAGGLFHVLPSLPPALGRVEMWLPAADVALGSDAAARRDETVDVYSS
jgi:signal transduction histidine kinase